MTIIRSYINDIVSERSQSISQEVMPYPHGVSYRLAFDREAQIQWVVIKGYHTVNRILYLLKVYVKSVEEIKKYQVKWWCSLALKWDRRVRTQDIVYDWHVDACCADMYQVHIVHWFFQWQWIKLYGYNIGSLIDNIFYHILTHG